MLNPAASVEKSVRDPGSTPAQALLTIENLQTHFFTAAGVVRAVDGVSYAVRSGEMSAPGERIRESRVADVLDAVRRESLPHSPRLNELLEQLKTVNSQLWDIEDDIRLCEHDQDFGPRFIALARAVYRTNDQRSALKRAINDLLGAQFIEEKSYPKYAAEDELEMRRAGN